MKALKHIGLALLYLLINLGITTSIHYCGNKITQISVLSTPKASCACDSIGKMNCCHDAKVQVKFELPSTLLAKVIVAKAVFIDLFHISTSTLYNVLVRSENNTVEYVNDHPPQQIQVIKTTMLRI